jgi:site-specific DNA-cytosine methylase
MVYRAIDVMGFAGGFTLGMTQAGFELAGKRELPGGFGVANCEANRHLLGDKWQTQVGHAESWEVIDGVDVVFGNPPCHTKLRIFSYERQVFSRCRF